MEISTPRYLPHVRWLQLLLSEQHSLLQTAGAPVAAADAHAAPFSTLVFVPKQFTAWDVFNHIHNDNDDKNDKKKANGNM